MLKSTEKKHHHTPRPHYKEQKIKTTLLNPSTFPSLPKVCAHVTFNVVEMVLSLLGKIWAGIWYSWIACFGSARANLGGLQTPDTVFISKEPSIIANLSRKFIILLLLISSLFYDYTYVCGQYGKTRMLLWKSSVRPMVRRNDT